MCLAHVERIGRTCVKPPQSGTRAVEPSAYAEPTHMNCSPFKSRIIVGRAAPIAVYDVLCVEYTGLRGEDMTHEFYGGQENREPEGEYDAPELPVLRHAIVSGGFCLGRGAGPFGGRWCVGC